MLLNKHNFAIATLASREETRFTLNAIQVTPDYTAETDGQQLVRVSTVKTAAETFPAIPGMEAPVDTWKPFLLPSREALNIAKALPKKSAQPVLLNAAVSAETDVNGHSVIGVTDLEFARAFRTRKPAGNFPQIERVIPRTEDARFRITLNARLLVRVLKQAESFQGDKDLASVVFSFTDSKDAVRLDAFNDEGQEFVGVIMPCRHDAAATERTRTTAEVDEMHRILVAIWNGLENANTAAALQVVEKELPNIQAVLERIHPPETDSPAADSGQAPPEPETVKVAPAPEPEPPANAPEPPAITLEACIEATEAAKRNTPPANEPAAPACDSTSTPPPAEPATVSATDRKEAVRRHWEAKRAAAAAETKPAAFRCPSCGAGSANRQGVVAHLRIVHRLDKAQRDAALAAAGI